jgi:hypothetical protein
LNTPEPWLGDTISAIEAVAGCGEVSNVGEVMVSPVADDTKATGSGLPDKTESSPSWSACDTSGGLEAVSSGEAVRSAKAAAGSIGMSTEAGPTDLKTLERGAQEASLTGGKGCASVVSRRGVIRPSSSTGWDHSCLHLVKSKKISIGTIRLMNLSSS